MLLSQYCMDKNKTNIERKGEWETGLKKHQFNSEYYSSITKLSLFSNIYTIERQKKKKWSSKYAFVLCGLFFSFPLTFPQQQRDIFELLFLYLRSTQHYNNFLLLLLLLLVKKSSTFYLIGIPKRVIRRILLMFTTTLGDISWNIATDEGKTE